MPVDLGVIYALDALTRRYQDVLVNVADSTSTAVGALWDRLGGITDVAQTQFADAAASLVARTQLTMARVTVAYIDAYVNTALRGRQNVGPVDIAAVVAQARQGIPPIEVYLRPAVTARTAIARGRTFAEAMQAARARATSAANTDVALAGRGAAQAAMERHPAIVGYRRVPDATACTFCLVASTQRYHVSDLMPLHNNCRCTVAPIISDRDQHVIGAAPERLQEIAAELKAQGVISPGVYGHSPADVIDVHMHGELGPVLTRAGDAFTRP